MLIEHLLCVKHAARAWDTVVNKNKSIVHLPKPVPHNVNTSAEILAIASPKRRCPWPKNQGYLFAHLTESLEAKGSQSRVMIL